MAISWRLEAFATLSALGGHTSTQLDEGTWTVTVRSECADYDGDDLERAEDDEDGPLDGV